MGILIVSTNISFSAAPAMSYCISPTCPAPDKNSLTTNFCMSCGAKILLKDRYRALKLLGQGGFGKTFKAVDEDQPRKPLCVIKQFAFSNNHPETRQIALKLFYEEAQHLEALGKHDQIPELLACFDVEGQPYLVQQFIDGQDLEQELATAGTFNQAKIRELLESLLPVLDFLHHQSPPVIHRDIKPANIIRRRSDGGLVLVDFGAAKQATQSMLAKTGTAIGSAEFAAPEQARRKPVFASDIYSLGVTCIYLLTQVSPFDLFDMNQDAWVWRDYLVNNPVDEMLGKVLDKMIANVLPQRYQSAAEVLSALDQKSNLQNAPDLINSIPESSRNKLSSFSDLAKNISQSQPTPETRVFVFESTKIELFTTKEEIINRTGFLGLNKDVKIKESLHYAISKVKGEAKYITEDWGDINLEMVLIPAGSFMMGGSYSVTLQPFYMSKNPITNGLYKAVMSRMPSQRRGDNRPVENVEWGDAVKFCQKLSKYSGRAYNLPSESQWEYACRAGTTTPFCFGNSITTDLANYHGLSGFPYPYKEILKGIYRGETTDVGTFPPNMFGLYDMHGNVWEWCLDTWESNYQGAPINGEARRDRYSNSRVLRGGSWTDGPNNCMSDSRKEQFYLRKSSEIGFRVVL
jgi:formylglycine-generating enzyme required for sulfatase activity